MKKSYYPRYIVMISRALLLILTVLLPVKLINAVGNNSTQVVRGERPPIDITSVPIDAIEPTIIRIRFSETLENYLDNAVISFNTDGTIRFGIPAIDLLNQQFGVFEVKKTFATALQNTKFATRHRLWGFHLWYDLIVPAGTDIRSMVKSYAAENEVQVSEPVYRKQLIGADMKAIPYEPASGGNIGLTYVPSDPRYNEQWHYNNTGQQSGTPGADIDLPEAWDITKGSSDVIVAVIDQGIQYTHTDLAANMWSGIGYNFVTSSSTISPGDHGTHVAGTIAANTNNAIGVSGIAGGTGTGDGVRLMSCQVFTSSSSGGFENAPIWAADNGAAISQNSWGYTSVGSYEQAVLDAIDYFNANGGGTVLNGGITIFAAGNSSSSGQWYPGCYSGSFSIAATGNQDMIAWYSNFGTWVDISAPGGETNTVTERGVLSCLTGNSYGFYQGTSMACPHASGVAALIISLAPGSLTPQDVKDILTSTTDNIDALNPSYAGLLGTGRLNAYQALLATQGYINPLLPSPPQSLTASAASTSQINLTWSLNAANDVVMLAYNTTNTFGVPTGNYTPGQLISGGGTVLYEGTLTSFQHLSLNTATTYYYTLWSKNGGYYSAVSRKANATTLCGIYTLPFSESFSGTSLPNCWSQVDHQGNGQVWQFGTITGQSPNPALTGNYAYLDSDAYGSGGSQNADLITPTLNLSGYSSVTLQFNHYFKSYSGSSGTLSYSINNGSAWTQIQQFTTTSSSNPTAFSQAIAAVVGQPQVKFKWNYTGSYGWYWGIDDIQITGVISAPTLSVTPPNQNVGSAAGTTTFTVTSNSAWTVTSNQSWCTVTPSGTGNGTITATYAQNTTAASRIANITVTVSGLTPVVVTVTQAAPTLSVTPSNQGVTALAGSTSFAVTSNSGWIASSDQTWCTVTPSGTGNGAITANYTQNMTATSRVANITVTVSGLTPVVVTVTQAAPALSVTPSNQGVTASAGSTSFAVTSNSGWIASSDQTWCTVTPSGTGNGAITANYTQNMTATSRVANITVTVSGLTPVVVTVTQAAPALSVTPSDQSVTASAGSTSFAVTSNSGWTAGSDQSWCTVTSSGTGNGSITANYTQNTLLSSRIATITVSVSGLTPVQVTVTQAGDAPTLIVTPSNQSVTSAAGNTSFSVTSNTGWTAISDQTWCTATPSGSSNGTITATYTENTLATPRVANIMVTVSGLTPLVVTVNQAAANLPEFRYTMANDVQTSDRTMEFDLLLVDLDPSLPFELATVQAGILANPAIYNGGSITASIVPGTSTLNASQQPTSVTFTQSSNVIKLASKAPPGAGNGTIISTNPASPSRICRLKLTNTVPWATAQPNLAFNFTNTPYGTKISQYIGGFNTALTTNATNCYSVCSNSLLNPPPTLSVAPLDQTVTANDGNTEFTVTSNAGWVAVSDQAWCTVTSSGYSNGTITATYSANSTSLQRIANITVTVTGLPAVMVTVTQNGIVNKTLNLTVFLEGLYVGGGLMHPAMDESGPHWGATIADKITVEFHDAGNYANLLYTASNVNLNTDGTASLTFPATFSGSYYVTIIHRNSIETVTSAPIPFPGSTTNYSFDNASKAFGGNMLYKGDGTWVIYGGDPNQDGLVDASDMVMIDNDANNFVTGYINNDVNGDGLIDAGDMILLDNNSSNFIAKVIP